MDLNKQAMDYSPRNELSVENIEEFEEIKFTFVSDSVNSVSEKISDEGEIPLNKFPIPPKTKSNFQVVKEYSISATQTPLMSTKLSSIKPSIDKKPIDSSTSPIRFENVGKTEFSFCLNNISINQKACETTNTLSGCPDLSEMSIKISREATGQVTPPHPSLIHGVLPAPRETLQISTSLSSSKSGPQSEVLTVTTDYATQSPDVHGTLLDGIDQSGNCGLHLSVQETFGLPRVLDIPVTPAQNNPSIRRTNRRRWRLKNFLRCTAAVPDEPDAPPTYSTIFANRTADYRPFHSTNQSIVATIPPPSYAQAQGICLTSYSMDHLLSVSPSSGAIWSPRPMTAICPRCMTIIITSIEIHQSSVTHVTAFVLCLCGCWPCCMLPYCMNSCKSIDHYCPICHSYLGAYRPW